MSNIIEQLNSETPVTLNALMKATGLTQTGLTLALVGLGGQVAVKDGGLVLAPPPAPAAPADRGPMLVGQVGRRPKAERLNEIAICRELIIDTIRNVGSTTAPSLHRDCGFSVDYRNIHRAAEVLVADGIIQEVVKGRTRHWILADKDLAAQAVGEFEVLGE